MLYGKTDLAQIFEAALQQRLWLMGEKVKV
jgi:hypothetical protein